MRAGIRGQHPDWSDPDVEPRATNDADLVVEFEAFNLVEFCHRLGDDFQLDRQTMLEGFTG
jgi:hypothetical protein